MERIPFVDLAAGHAELGSTLQETVARVVASGWYLLGPELERFEQEFADYCGVRHCVGVGSGLSAIELALRAAGVGPGDEVIVPGYTWIATWLAVSRAGAIPVGVDVDEATYNIDPDLIAEKITSRTAAIVPVHLRGEPADMEAITQIAAERGLLVVEDAAQAHGALHRGCRVGSLGDAGSFSFYPSKNLGGLGDGGAVTTDDDDLAEKVRLFRNYGMRNRYEVEAEGVNSRLSEIQAAVLRLKLGSLDVWNQSRAELAAIYRSRLEVGEGIALPQPPAWADPVWHLFVVGCAERDRCLVELREQGVEALVHYPLLPHLSPPYVEAGWRPGTLPVAESLADAALSLPMYPQLTPSRCEQAAELLLRAVSCSGASGGGDS